MPIEQSHKTCRVCNENKPRSEFYKHPAQRDGLFHECKSCYKAWYQKYRKTPEGTQVYVQGQKKYWSSEQGKKKRREATARARKRFPEKARARLAVMNAIRRGRLVRPENCQCGRHRSEARIEAHHHRGYSKQHWLDVQWLCSKCHYELDKGTMERLWA